MKEENLLLLTDSYKVNHWNQYPDNTENVYSYFESRKGAEYNETVFFGLQYIIKKYLEGEVVTKSFIDDAEFFYTHHFGTESLFNREGWEYIYNKHGGNLPIRIKAVEEGIPVPTGNVLMTVEVTDEKVPWLTNFLETILTHVWYPSTVATRSREIKKLMYKGLYKSCENPEQAIPFMLHDFGFRGTSSLESASIGGLAHLINFCGTDTVPALKCGAHYYNASLKELGFSVPASEHSVATAKGEEYEEEYLKRMISLYPKGIVSIVADSYDITRFVETYIRDLKDDIIKRWENRENGLPCKVVIRPDSPRYEGDTPHSQVAWLLDSLWDIFGGTINSKGYRVLHESVGVIYGDGLTIGDIDKIYRFITNHENFGGQKAFDCSAVVVGQGGGLLQKLNRDTQRFAFKCSAQKRNGVWYDVLKNPLDKTKKSKAGRLALVKTKDPLEPFITIKEQSLFENDNMLKTVFENGVLLQELSFDKIRSNARL